MSDRQTRPTNSRLTGAAANPRRRRFVRHAPEGPFCHAAKREAPAGPRCTRVYCRWFEKNGSEERPFDCSSG
jgi:hypothetical protein